MRGPTYISVRCEECYAGYEADIPNLGDNKSLLDARNALTATLRAEGWHVEEDAVWCPPCAARNEEG